MLILMFSGGVMICPSSAPGWVSSSFVTVHFASSYVSLIFLFCTLASRYLAPFPSRVHCFPSYIFHFASVVAAYLPFAYFSCHPGMFLFSSLVIFHVFTHGFGTFCTECGLRSHGDFIACYSPESE